MRTLSDAQWQRYFDALARLRALPLNERRGALSALCGAPADSDVAALLEAHLALKPDVDRCRNGERIRNLLLHERIGSGGMGCVYRATQTFCDGVVEREVAVKLIHPAQLLHDACDAQRRFRAELGALVRLEHEGIARFYDGGIDRCPGSGEQTWFLAMELVRGEPLTAYIARHRGRLQAEGIVRVFLRVCSAVAHAHKHGIVHCDLKPANVLVDEHEAPRLIDFGLAARCREVAAAGGTPNYSSPEQLAGEPATPAMDVYALGVILHELLTGAVVGSALAGVVAKACAADAAQRYATTTELARALSRCTGPMTARLQPSRHRDHKARCCCRPAVGGRAGVRAFRAASRRPGS